MYNTQLETFIKVADTGSFSKAGEELFVTPTAIIKQINSLESRLDLKLFIRTHRGLKLTEAGKLLYKDAKYIIEYSKQAIEKAKKVEEKIVNTVRVGISLMTPGKKLIDIWLKISNEYPDINLEIIPFENKPERAKEILENMGKEIDVIVAIHDDALLGLKTCIATKLFDEPLCCALSINHHLASKDKLIFEDLDNENLMLIHKGWNKAMDSLREEIIENHNKVNIMDFNFFNLDIFNECENSKNILVIADNFTGIHPLIKILPVEWDFKTPFSILHSSKPNEVTKKFIKIIKNYIKLEN
jgi:hypothetical protein